MTAVVHTYRTNLTWEGSTGVGYDAYDRTHVVTAPPAEKALTLASDPAFNGNPSLMNPEQLLVLAASSCQLLSFLAVAARARIDVLAYEDSATAVMPTDDQPMRITRIELRPTITVGSGQTRQPTDERLQHLCEVAHRQCYVANSLRTEIVIQPSFARRDEPRAEV